MLYNPMEKKRGILVISLDFELYWGVRDKRSIRDYEKNLLGVRSVVPLILDLFSKYEIHATWTTVGFLFFDTREKLIIGLPDERPNYVKPILSPYNHVNDIGDNELEDPFHFANSLIKMINSSPNMEIGSHTFSHYYCLEEGQNISAFENDLKCAIEAANDLNINIESLVFPRNQFNPYYMSVCIEKGFKSYRGNEPSWSYKPRRNDKESLLVRGLRLLDAYINLSGHNDYSLDEVKHHFPFNIRSSRFLRPYSKYLRSFEGFRLRRIKSGLNHAAKNGLIYHLWWHPHNFGSDIDKNLSFLKDILEYYFKLHKRYGMKSLNMKELSTLIMEIDYEK